MSQQRVVFDFQIHFSNGGDLRGRDFRLDIEHDRIEDRDLAELIVRDLRLLMVERVRITRKAIVCEPHKRHQWSGDQAGEGGSNADDVSSAAGDRSAPWPRQDCAASRR